jgi:corrinoid protein of di/trimethylamine methyltransferase
LKREEILKGLADATLAGDSDKTAMFAKEALSSGVDAYDAIMEGCAQGMKIVSDKYESGDMFVPEILLSAEAMYAAIDILKPHLKAGKASATGTVVIGVVEGDIHDIGKNLVRIMLDASGYQIVDMGRDVPIKDMAAKAKDVKADIVAISTLMTTTMPNMKKVVEELTSLGIKGKTMVLIGGAPTSMDFAKSIGADSWCKDATSAVKEAEKLVMQARR